MNNILKNPNSEEGKFIQYSSYLQLDLSLIFWGFTIWSQSFLQYIFVLIDGFLVFTCGKEAMKYSDEYKIDHDKLVKIAVLTVLVYIIAMILIQSFTWISICVLAIGFAFGLSRLAKIIAYSKSDSKEAKFINSHFRILRQYTQQRGAHKQTKDRKNDEQ